MNCSFMSSKAPLCVLMKITDESWKWLPLLQFTDKAYYTEKLKRAQAAVQ